MRGHLKLLNNTMSYTKRFIYSIFVLYSFLALTLLCSSVRAGFAPDKVINASTPNPVGSGARAVGMGGAFIAVADDATAASWNPAGLTQLKKPEISFAYSYFRRRDDFSSSQHPEMSSIQKDSSTDLNYLSIAYPFELFERNMIVSLNYQQLYDFDREIKTNLTSKSIDPPSTSKNKVKFRQSGKLRALSPAYAIEITPDFSLGFTFNIWTDKLFWSNGWTSDTTINAKAYSGGMLGSRGYLTNITKSEDHDRFYGFSGFNMNIGFLWDINRFLTVGGVIKTPFTADIKHERVVTTTLKGLLGPILKTKVRVDENVDLDMPLSYGLGVALRFTDKLTVSLDVYRTEWDHFRLKDGEGIYTNPITGKLNHDSDVDSTTQVRLGAEYLLVFTKTVVPLRCGLFYDPEPSEKNPDDFWGFTLGTGISIGDLIFDCAYQFRYGNNVGGNVFDIPSTSADVTQHLLMWSFIYHF